ncbi:hypothetical protein CN278_27910 [Bacillus thuringiensis]|nr:hypothetical protein COM67_09050 [Bacillus thuringiensis]PEB57433.1 hypothetical protein COM79_14925 [Bacillus cereus]PEB67779.1 hypothetical protein COM91_21845 [Bacillus thuringiensis]PEB87117.1 hypothetical protein COM94_11305 [Bacillus thuringiensis]PEQ54915.1 hypothetical protein CN473_06275 [Bacillus thuringiensis]
MTTLEMLAVSPITLTICQSEEQKELVEITTSSFLSYSQYTGYTNYLIIHIGETIFDYGLIPLYNNLQFFNLLFLKIM